MTRRRAALVGLALLAACSGAACTSVLGLDPPVLDVGLNEGGSDAPVTATDAADAGDAGDGSAAGPESGAEAAADTGASCMDARYDGSGGAGVRCGGGCYPVVYCTGATPVCCQTTDGQGATTFQCTSSDTACTGYPIECENENDCSGSNVCCHYEAHTICAASCTSNGDIACVPGSADDCPAGEACDVPATNAGVQAPYFTCGDE